MWPFSKPKQPPEVPAPMPERETLGMFSTDWPHPQRLGLGSEALSARAFVKQGPLAQGMDAANVFGFGALSVPEAQASWYVSQGFIGYQMCAVLAQHWLINKACLIPARDAIRHGFKITVNGGEVKPEVIEALTKANKRYRLDAKLVEFVKMGRVFGIRLALCVVDNPDPEYYSKPFNIDSVTPGSYKGIVQIDPYWVTPELTEVNTSDPTSPNFYEPTYWNVWGRRYHKSHFVIMRGPEVGDVLKPSYLFGGLSVPQMIYERVYAAERTANEAPQLAMTKRTTTLYTDLAKTMADPAKFNRSLERWAQLRDNYGVKVADTNDRVEQSDTGLADLDAVIMTQYQIVAAAANIPATKLLGTTPKGFNATGDYEADSYHEELESIQTNDMEPLVVRHLQCVMRSEVCPRFGIKPFDFDVTWEPVKSTSAADLAATNLAKANAAKIYAVDIGAVEAAEVRAQLAADEHSGFNGLAELQDLDPDADEEAQNMGG